jgi:hypothetical protein
MIFRKPVEDELELFRKEVVEHNRKLEVELTYYEKIREDLGNSKRSSI